MKAAMKDRSLDRLFKMLDERAREIATLRKLLERAEDILFHYEIGDRTPAALQKQTNALNRQSRKYVDGIAKRLTKKFPHLRGKL